MDKSNKEPSNIDKLKETTKSLLILLENPQPGCFTWHEAIHEKCDQIAYYAPSYTLVRK